MRHPHLCPLVLAVHTGSVPLATILKVFIPVPSHQVEGGGGMGGVLAVGGQGSRIGGGLRNPLLPHAYLNGVCVFGGLGVWHSGEQWRTVKIMCTATQAVVHVSCRSTAALWTVEPVELWPATPGGAHLTTSVAELRR